LSKTSLEPFAVISNAAACTTLLSACGLTDRQSCLHPRQNDFCDTRCDFERYICKFKKRTHTHLEIYLSKVVRQYAELVMESNLLYEFLLKIIAHSSTGELRHRFDKVINNQQNAKRLRDKVFCRQTQCVSYSDVAVCVSVTLMYCAHTTESIIMRPSPDCSPTILVFPRTPNMNPIAREDSAHRGRQMGEG